MKSHHTLASLASMLALYATATAAIAAPTVYIPLGSANQVIAVDAASDRITATYDNVIDSHGLVATPDGEYLIAGSVTHRMTANWQHAEGRLLADGWSPRAAASWSLNGGCTCLASSDP